MSKRFDTLIEKYFQRRNRRDWKALAETAADLDLGDLKHYRGLARQLHEPLNRFLNEADHRLALPIIGSNAIETPVGSDWSWRPDLWRGQISPRGHASAPSKTTLGRDVTLFHDCHLSELTCRQMRNISEFDLAPFGLRLDVFHFDGSFLSLSIALPPEGVNALSNQHILRVNTLIETEKPLELFARLNIRHGPNTEQIVRELPPYDHEQVVEFDLAYTSMDAQRLDGVWLDIIFEGPELNQIYLRDLTFSRRPRADV